jgi:hypothetical protein
MQERTGARASGHLGFVSHDVTATFPQERSLGHRKVCSTPGLAPGDSAGPPLLQSPATRANEDFRFLPSKNLGYVDV